MTDREKGLELSEVSPFDFMDHEHGSYIPAQGQDTGANDLVKAVDQLLNELGPKFSKVSSELFERSMWPIF